MVGRRTAIAGRAKLKLRFGIALPVYGGWLRGQPKTDETSFEYAKKVALKAEELGFDSIWIPDHLLNYMVGEGEPCPESWIWLSALAALTNSIRLGHMVLCYAFRSPTLTAKMIATLDDLSGGRLNVGIGACNFKREFEAYGYPWPEGEERYNALAEYLEVVKGTLTSPEGFSFKGKFFFTSNCILNPKPIQKPHPPIWVGGESSQVQELVAKYGDVWFFYGDSPEGVDEKIRRFEETWGLSKKYAMNSRLQVGRPKAEIEQNFKELARGMDPGLVKRVLSAAIIGTPDECIEKLEAFTNTKLDYIILMSNNTLKDIERFGKEVMPSFS